MAEPVPIRKRMQRWEIAGEVRFITFSCQRRLPLLASARMCEVFMDALGAARLRYGVRVFAWVLMPEHVHLLLMPRGDSTIETFLRSLKMAVAKRAIEGWKKTGSPMLEKVADSAGSPRFWQAGGGFDRNVRSRSEFAQEVAYIHRNPVKRGLVSKPEEWRWSSVRWWMGERDGEFACDEPPGRPGDWALWKRFM